MWGKKLNIVEKLERAYPCAMRADRLGVQQADDVGLFVCRHPRVESHCAVLSSKIEKSAQVLTANIATAAGQQTAIQLHNCMACPFRETPLSGKLPKIKTRNLIYHCAPLVANDGWRENLAKVRQHIDLFNGRRIVAIACSGPGQGSGYQTHSPDVVREALAGCGCEFVDVPNDPVLRECVSFLQLLLRIHSTDAHEATFYAHSKGNATLQTSDRSLPDASRLRGVVRWRNAMYRHLLGDSGKVMDLLRRHACVGTTQIEHAKLEPYRWGEGLSHGYWHFAGTFFWFRHDRIFTRPTWRNVPTHHYGVEAWLGGFVPIAETASALQPWDKRACPQNGMYDPATYGSKYDE